MIRVLICDDQVIICEGLAAILETDPQIEVVGLANDGAEAIEMIPSLKPNLFLMDLKTPGMNGIQATDYITHHFPEIKVLVLTTYSTDEWIFDSIHSGAAGFLLKGTPKAQLLEAVKGTMANKTYIEPSIGSALCSHITNHTTKPDTTLASDLSDRELDILRLLAKGMTNSEIANKLSLSYGTVRNYVSSIYNKLGVLDRTQAALFAMRHGIINLDS